MNGMPIRMQCNHLNMFKWDCRRLDAETKKYYTERKQEASSISQQNCLPTFNGFQKQITKMLFFLHWEIWEKAGINKNYTVYLSNSMFIIIALAFLPSFSTPIIYYFGLQNGFCKCTNFFRCIQLIQNFILLTSLSGKNWMRQKKCGAWGNFMWPKNGMIQNGDRGIWRMLHIWTEIYSKIFKLKKFQTFFANYTNDVPLNIVWLRSTCKSQAPQKKKPASLRWYRYD